MRIEQVVTNLITNAVKYGDGKPVQVRVEACPEGALLVVHDHGIGIDAADQARIFERFERVDPSRHATGLGLGLWIAREIVEAHGGRIALANRDGGGLMVSLSLPT
jgi:signal transduction histidine kinase